MGKGAGSCLVRGRISDAEMYFPAPHKLVRRVQDRGLPPACSNSHHRYQSLLNEMKLIIIFVMMRISPLLPVRAGLAFLRIAVRMVTDKP